MSIQTVNQEIATKDFSVWYDIETATIFCKGALRLKDSQDYRPIFNLFEAVMAQNPPLLQLNLLQLDFLNSSGINMLLKLVIRVRQKENLQMAIVGSKRIPWQIKSLRNLQRLMPNLQLEFVGS